MRIPVASILFFTSIVFAVVPPTYSVDGFYSDAKFIGVVTIVSGEAQFDENGKVCGINYKSIITHSAYGPSVGSIIDLHLLKDIREEQNLDPFEVGSNYFIYAEDRKTHRFLQLSDMIYRFPEYSENCHAKGNNSLYVYREFSGRVHDNDDYTYVESRGLKLLKELRSVNSAYYSENTFSFIKGIKTIEEMHKEKLHFQGYILEDLIDFLTKKMQLLNQTPQPTPKNDAAGL